MLRTDNPNSKSSVQELAPDIPDRAFDGPIAWRRDDIRTTDWHVPLSKDALAELDTIADALTDFEGDVKELGLDAFDWPATTEIMTDVRLRMMEGVGFAVIDRLPVERWSEEGTRGVSWMVTSLLGTPIMQKKKGARIYDVRDTGAAMKHGVRRSVTNLAQEFHTDGSWLALTPESMGLTCLRQAESGGMSRVVSLETAHNVLREEQPDLLARLYRPYYWDRQAEHDDDSTLSTYHPVFEWDGREWMSRYYEDYIRNGHSLMDAPVDDEGDAALNALREIVERPENWYELRLEPGQIEYLNNRKLAHGRTGFRDPQGEDQHRHLLRYWMRTVGGIELDAEL